MKINIKLVVTIGVFNIISICLLAGVTIILSQREIGRLVDEQAQNLAVRSGEQIGKWLGENMAVIRTLARIMEGYKEIPAAERRERFDFMLKNAIIADSTIESIYANWSSNGLDGMDAEYANTPGTDETGRYIPLFIKGPNGLMLTAIKGFEWDVVMQLPITSDFVLEPDVPPESKNLIANMCCPVKDNGRMIGIIGSSIELATVQAFVEEIKPFGDGVAFLFSSGGIVAAHSDPSRRGKDMRETESDTFGPYLDTMVDAVTRGTKAAFSYRPSQADTVIQYYSVPFTIGRVPSPWTLVVGVSYNTIMMPIQRMLVICLILGALAIVFMSLGVFFMARSISRPINSLALMFKDISEGEGDLTKTITIKADNEIGALAHYFNLTIDKIKRLVLAIKKETAALMQTGTELSANMEETTASISEITATVGRIESRSGDQAVSVKGTGTIMMEIVKDIESLNVQIQKQIDCVSQSSSAVEEMLTNIQSVTQMLIKNEGTVTELAQASGIGMKGLQEVSSDIQEIAKESEGLLEINTVMQNIASQTNLLSMNAAIEAAHAGEAGKGFAVVADEIRKLAESSSKQSKTTSEVLKKIKGSIDKITKSTADVLLKFEAISEGVRKVTEQEANVRSAMEEQGTGSKSILESIGSLNEITSEVTGSARAMGVKSREVIKESQELEEITREIRGGMREMTAGAEQISRSVERADDISVENKKQIDTLMGEVSRFKVE
jgi:methyl-accepting chemotaxis protein